MQGRQRDGHHNDDEAADVVDHLGVLYHSPKVEATFVVAFHFLPVTEMDNGRDSDEHRNPSRGAGEECAAPMCGRHVPGSPVKLHHASDEDDHVEDKRHDHVDVDHAADHFAPLYAQRPLISGVIVNPKWHRYEEDEVREDEVEYCDGGGGDRAGSQDAHHQAQADGTTQ